MHWDTFKQDNYRTVGEEMGDVGLVRYKPALLPPCPTITLRGLSYSNSQRSTHDMPKWNFQTLTMSQFVPLYVKNTTNCRLKIHKDYRIQFICFCLQAVLWRFPSTLQTWKVITLKILLFCGRTGHCIKSTCGVPWWATDDCCSVCVQPFGQIVQCVEILRSAFQYEEQQDNIVDKGARQNIAVICETIIVVCYVSCIL